MEIVEALKPFISGELSTLKSTVKTAVEMLGSLKLSCDALPEVKSSVLKMSLDLPKSLSVVTSSIEATQEASESVVAVLETFGFAASSGGIDVPKCISAIENSFNIKDGKDTGQPAPLKHSGECNYRLVTGKPNVMECVLGCPDLVHTVGGSSLPGVAGVTAGFVSDSSQQLGGGQYQLHSYDTTPAKPSPPISNNGQSGSNFHFQGKRKKNPRLQQLFNQKVQKRHQPQQQQQPFSEGLIYLDNQPYQQVQQVPLTAQQHFPQQQVVSRPTMNQPQQHGNTLSAPGNVHQGTANYGPGFGHVGGQQHHYGRQQHNKQPHTNQLQSQQNHGHTQGYDRKLNG